MDSASRYDAVIVGGGLAGTTLMAELARTAPPSFRALLIDAGEPGPGSAYAPASEHLYLNGTAAAMSAAPDDKADLVRWLGDEPEHALVSRRLFGRYLIERFRGALAARPLFDAACAEVVDVMPGKSGYVISDARGDAWAARDVVLALGNFPPDDSFLPEALRTSHDFVADPWRFEPRRMTGDVLLIGSGLTAMDTIALLDERGFRGAFHLVSRHGLLPCAENPFARALDLKGLALSTLTPYALLHSLRKAARDHVARGGDWRDVVESLRASSPAIWMSWTLRDRKRFLRHLQAYWAIHRYRVPPQTATTYARLEQAGRIVRHRGSVAGARKLRDGRLSVEIAGAGCSTAVAVGTVVNCTGPNGDYARVRHALVRNLLQRGLLRPDALRLGLDATPELRTLDRRGQVNAHLFALGPPLRGLFYETTAVPETCAQAARVASALAREPLAADLEAAS